MTSTRRKNKGGWGQVKCHGPLICLQQSYGTLSERVRHVRLGEGGLNHYHLQWQMAPSPLFSLRVPPRD